LKRDERPLSAVSPWVWAGLALLLAAQFAWRLAQPPPRPMASDLPPAPSAKILRLASLGEPEATARLLMLYLQAYDYSGTNATAYRQLDYARLTGWLGAILALDPASEYPLFSAARVYAEIPDALRSRMALDFIYHEFFADPDHRWPWLAHAALLAKHRLNDLPLARRYAAAIDRYTRSPNVPLWAKQMEVFILEDMGELDAARIMLGGMLESGAVQDPSEARFLASRLKELEARTRTPKH
jgi:GNAT superfamily N-acetyltransferase